MGCPSGEDGLSRSSRTRPSRRCGRRAPGRRWNASSRARRRDRARSCPSPWSRIGNPVGSGTGTSAPTPPTWTTACRVARAHGRLPVPQPGAPDEPHGQFISTFAVSLRRGAFLPASDPRSRRCGRPAASQPPGDRCGRSSSNRGADFGIRSAVPRQSRRDGALPGFTALPARSRSTRRQPQPEPRSPPLVAAAWVAWGLRDRRRPGRHPDPEASEFAALNGSSPRPTHPTPRRATSPSSRRCRSPGPSTWSASCCPR